MGAICALNKAGKPQIRTVFLEVRMLELRTHPVLSADGSSVLLSLPPAPAGHVAGQSTKLALPLGAPLSDTSLSLPSR